jgi:hypothetical protein
VKKLFSGLMAAALLAASATLVTGSVAVAQPLTWCSNHSAFAILGDSASVGYGVVDVADNTWYNQFSRFNGNATIDNYAVGGKETADYLPGGSEDPYSKLAAAQPPLVFIELGGNDAYYGVTPAVYQANLNSIVSDVWNVSPNSSIVIMSTWEIDARAPGVTGSPWSAYSSAAQTVAVNRGVGLVLWMQVLPVYGSTAANDAAIYYNNSGHDTVPHLNDAGQLIVAAQINMLVHC